MMEPDWTAQMDQLVVGARDLAKAAAAFYRSLLDEDIPEAEAVQLTTGWMHAILSTPRDDTAA